MNEKFIKIINILSQKTWTMSEFLNVVKDSPFFYSKSLAEKDELKQIFGHAQFYKFESFINEYTKKHINEPKINLYKKIDQLLDSFINSMQIENVMETIKNALASDADRFPINEREIILKKINNIKISDYNKYVLKEVIDEINSRRDFYLQKAKSWINRIYEDNEFNKSNNKSLPEVFSLEELKTLNQIGKFITIDKQLVNEIDDSVKDKFVWLNGEYIDSSMGYGVHHGAMYMNKLKELNQEQIDSKTTKFISNTRSPDDLLMEVNEKNKKLPAAFGSFYFNGEVCIIEGRYLIALNDKNYNLLVKDLKKRFKHVYDLSIKNKQIKQESNIRKKERIK